MKKFVISLSHPQTKAALDAARKFAVDFGRKAKHIPGLEEAKFEKNHAHELPNFTYPSQTNIVIGVPESWDWTTNAADVMKELHVISSGLVTDSGITWKVQLKDREHALDE